MNKAEINRNILVIFNLKTDRNDPLLAFTITWINEFASKVDQVWVYSTHIGEYNLANNVKLYELGGGSIHSRFLALCKLFRVGLQVVKKRRNAIVFHHMSIKTASILGIFFKMFLIPQALWYSHSNVTLELKMAAHFVDLIFSSTPHSLPIKTKKGQFIGHGIDTTSFQEFSNKKRLDDILSLGRISHIKNNEALIYALANTNRKNRTVHLVGPLLTDTSYLVNLIKYGKDLGVAVEYLGSISHEEIPNLVQNYSICYTGNPNTVDKSVIEGAMGGCFTLASQEFILEQTGTKEILNMSGIEFTNDISEQIEIFDKLANRNDLRIALSKIAKEKNDIRNLATKILDELRKL